MVVSVKRGSTLFSLASLHSMVIINLLGKVSLVIYELCVFHYALCLF